MQPDSFQTHSLFASTHGAAIRRVLAAAIQAVDPHTAVLSRLKVDGDLLVAGGQPYDLSSVRRIVVAGAGKAGAPMARAVSELLGERISAGLVIVKDGHAGAAPRSARYARYARIEIHEAAHPVPDMRGVQATRRLSALLDGLTRDDLLICLISGGGSALLTAPDEDISLPDLQALTGLLLACGADINEINCLRKHLDQVKGGGLARRAAPARVLTLILSDVMGNPLDGIASGPCVPDPSTYPQALALLEKYSLLDKVPAAIRAHLQKGQRGELPETPKPGDLLFARVQNLVIADNARAAQAALAQARAEGWQTHLLPTPLQGEARDVGEMLAGIARQAAARGARPLSLLAGGETTVTLRGGGLGGRNQELALAAVPALAGLPDVTLVTLATDGGDGPTDAAGAVVTGQSLARAASAGLSVPRFLENNDAYHFFQPLGDLLLPGPTLTNVNDLAFIFLL